MRPEPVASEEHYVHADAIDTERYVATLRRNAVLMAMIVAVITGGVAVGSLLMPKAYKATTDIIVLDRDALTPANANIDVVRNRLATLRPLVTTSAVLRQAADQLGVDPRALQGHVSASTDEESSLLSISAVGETPEGAQRLANTVARSFVEEQNLRQRARVRTVINSLSRQIEQLRAAGAQPGDEQLRPLERRRGELVVADAAVGADLQIARAAELLETAFAPRPVRNTVLAFFGSLLLAVLLALGREQLRPRLTARELSQLLATPILATLPGSERRLGRRRPRTDGSTAHRTLVALLRLAVPTDGSHSVLVTSAGHGEGRTTLVHRLGTSLAEAGQRTLVVSADSRRPDLDVLYGVQDRPGWWDLLTASQGFPMLSSAVAEEAIVAPNNGQGQTPDVLPSGSRRFDPEAVPDSRAVRAVLEALVGLGYQYVLVDGPPVLGDVPDAVVLASACNQVLVVGHPERVSASDAWSLKERLDHVGARLLGLAVMDSKAPVNSGYEPLEHAGVHPPPGEPIGR